MIKLKNIKKTFKNKKVLTDINIEIEKGQIFALIGPNGAGKTTTLRLINGEINPNGGEIEVMGYKNPENAKKYIAILREERTTLPKFTIGSYKNIYKLLYPMFNEKILDNFLMHYSLSMGDVVEKLSAGTKTILYLALSMASGAEILLLDEPTHNLDPLKKDEILKLLRNFSQYKNATIVISSHEIYELEELITSFAIIKEGKILYQNTLDGAKEKHRLIQEKETMPEGEVIAITENGTLIKTDKDIGVYPNFKDIVIGYLKKDVEISLF